MTEQLLQNLIQYGGGVAIIISLAFLFGKVAELMGKKKNNNGEERIKIVEERLRKIEENDLHDLNYIRDRVDKLWEEYTEIDKRVVRIETKLFNNNKESKR